MSQETETPERTTNTVQELEQYLTSCADEINNIDDTNSGDQHDVYSNAADEVALAVVDGDIAEKNIEGYLKPLANADGYETEPSLANKTRAKVDKYTPESEKKTPLDQWVSQNLQTIEIVKDKLTNQTKFYRWKFADLEAPTGVQTEGEHRDWTKFKRQIRSYDDFLRLGKPTEPVRGGEEWVDFVDDLIYDYGVEVEDESPQYRAYETLVRKVKTADVYSDRERAWMSGNAVYRPEDDDRLSSDYVYLPQPDINKIRKEEDIEHANQIQAALVARGIVSDGERVSRELQHGTAGDNRRWWRFPVDSFPEVSFDVEDSNVGVPLGAERATAGDDDD